MKISLKDARITPRSSIHGSFQYMQIDDACKIMIDNFTTLAK